MSDKAVNAFMDETRRLTDYYRKEWQMSYAEMIGALRVLTREVEDEMLDDSSIAEQGFSAHGRDA